MACGLGVCGEPGWIAPAPVLEDLPDPRERACVPCICRRILPSTEPHQGSPHLLSFILKGNAFHLQREIVILFF